MWRLPPQQRILKPSETVFDLHRVAQELTVIISTSVADFTPNTEPVLAALESLQANVALRWCRKILVFDKVPSQDQIDEMRRDKQSFHWVTRGPKWMKMWNAKRQDYTEYCASMQSLKEANHPALFNVELVFLPQFGHLYGTVKSAFSMLATRFAFVMQHDLRLGGHFEASDVQLILEAIHSGMANYIMLNRDANSSVRTKTYFRLVPGKSVLAEDHYPRINLTAMAGFSDQAHFVEADWYRRDVLNAIHPNKQLTCMEHVLHEEWKDHDIWRGTFLYGSIDDGPYILDLVYGLQVFDQEGHLRKLPPPPTRPAA